MRRVAILDCPACIGEQTFVLYAPTIPGVWDEHMSECEACGYVYGYIDSEPTTVVDEAGVPHTTYASRPVLGREVLEAGMSRLQTQTAEHLAARYGADWRAQSAAMQVHRIGMETEDPATRARNLRSTAPDLRRKA